MRSFLAKEWTTLAFVKKSLALVENPIECLDFAHLVGHDVLIDGAIFRVRGVEGFAHSPPWRAGELIGLMVGE